MPPGVPFDLRVATLGSWPWPLIFYCNQKYHSLTFIPFDLNGVTLTLRSRPWSQGCDLDIKVMTLTLTWPTMEWNIHPFIAIKNIIPRPSSHLTLRSWPWPQGRDLDLGVMTLTFHLALAQLSDPFSVIKNIIPWPLSHLTLRSWPWPQGRDLDPRVTTLTLGSWPWPFTWPWHS